VDELSAMVRGTAHAPASPASAPPTEANPASGGADSPPSLVDETDSLRRRFDEAVEQHDVHGAVEAILALDDAMVAWSSDTLQSDALDQARRQLRAMVVRLGDLALAGVHDPRQIVAPVVEAVLAARATARGERDFATSDLLRDVLTGAGVTVNDTPDGVGWSLADDERPDAATP
jgi:cysteinyl-tRNA synthetase